MGTTSREASWTEGKPSNKECVLSESHHSRAGERIPAKPDTISVLHIAPLIFQRLVFHPG